MIFSKIQKHIDRRITFVILFSFIFLKIVNAQDSLLSEYDNLVEDLSNIKTFGYKGIIPFSSEKLLFPYINGVQIWAGKKESYAIQGKGFFKVYDKKNNKYYYTRFGQFYKDGDDYYTFDALEGYGYQLIGKVIPVNEERNKNDENVQKITTSTCDLAYPIDEAKFIRNGKYFSFSAVNILKDQILINGHVELSTVDVLKTLTRMLFILRKIEEDKKNTVLGIKAKIFILESLWSLTLQKEANGVFESSTYEYYDKVFPSIFRSENLTSDDINWWRATYYCNSIIDIAPYLKRDY